MKNIFLSSIIVLSSLIGFNSCQDNELNETFDNVETQQAVQSSPSKVISAYKISAPIVLNGASNMTISGLEITNPNGNCITLTNCSNIVIENCKLGPSKGEGVSVQSSSNITIKYNTMESIRTGVYALSSSGLKVEYNDVKNVVGPMPRGQMVQLDKVNGAGISISYNTSENISGQSAPEDVISMYQTNGTSESPIKIVGNWIRGGGPSTSGGGIMTGDGGGSYVHVEGNILVNPGQYGISIAGGHHIVVTKNKVFAEKLPWNNIGIYTWNQSSSLPSHTNTMSYNEVNFKNSSGTVNNWWNAGNMGDVAGWSTNVYNQNLTASVLPAVILGRHQTTTTPTTPTTTQISVIITMNWSQRYLTVQTNPKPENGKISIYGTNGQLKIQQAVTGTTNTVNVGTLSNGYYIVKVTNNGTLLKEQRIKIYKR